MGGSWRVRWALAVLATVGLGACSGMAVGRSAGMAAAGVSFATGGSCGMFPFFKPGDRLQLDSDVGELRRGDVVSYRVSPPGEQPYQMVHRVVGLPGERLDPGPDGGILLNGAPLLEDYLQPGMNTYLQQPIEIPPDHWAVMGDNRGMSSDSRVLGPIPRSDIGAKVTKVDPVKTDEDNDCPVAPVDSSAGLPTTDAEPADQP